MLYNFVKKQSPNGTYHAFINFNNEVFKREQWPSKDRFGKLYDYHIYLYIDTSKVRKLYIDEKEVESFLANN